MRNLPGSFTMRKNGLPSNGTDWFRIVNKKNSESDIFIYDEIGFWGTTASDFVKQLGELDAKTLNVHINSPGGEIFDGIAIYNALKSNKATVNVYIDSLAASAASFIAQAGDRIIAARNSQIMIHDGIGLCFGNQQDMIETGDLLGQLSDNIADIYSQRAGGTVEEWRGLMRAETWYNGREAVDAGLADEVTDPDPEEGTEDSVENRWDLSFFNYAGREKAESPSRVRERVLVTNRAKETQVPTGKPKNQDGSVDQPSSTPAEGETPATEPAAEPAVAPAPAEPLPETPHGEPASDGEPVVDSAIKATAVNASTGVIINGVRVTDFAAIQAHVSMLENAQQEAQDTHRRDFVAQLSDDNKIPATQVDALTEFALGLSNEQFSKWSASYESAPAASLFEKHGPDSSTSGTAKDDKTNKIEELRGIVAMHERSMSPEKVKNTQSYIELHKLLGDENA
jgi:ATP-dependent protease ClpP protease subunit